MKEILRRWWPLLAWAALIVASSSTFVSTKDFVQWMSEHSPWTFTEQEFGVFWSDWWWLFVKGFHVLEFTVLFLLVRSTLSRMRLRPSANLSVSYLATMAFAAGDEWHQTFVPQRGGRLTDLLIDMAGATLLVLSILARTARLSRRTVQNRGVEPWK